MIKGSDGYEYATLKDCFVGRKAHTRYNQRRSDIERLFPNDLVAFDERYAQALQCSYGSDRATEIAWWSVIDRATARRRPQGPGSPDRAGQPGAGPAPTDLVHPADQPSV